jgi:hypothetical protein
MNLRKRIFNLLQKMIKCVWANYANYIVILDLNLNVQGRSKTIITSWEHVMSLVMVSSEVLVWSTISLRIKTNWFNISKIWPVDFFLLINISKTRVVNSIFAKLILMLDSVSIKARIQLVLSIPRTTSKRSLLRYLLQILILHQ